MLRGFIFICVLPLALSACYLHDKKATPPDDMDLLTRASSIKSQTACLAEGGRWQKAGIAQQLICVLPTTDAGKECRDNSQCEVACMLKGDFVEPGTKVIGQCNDSTDVFGCTIFVTDGKAEPLLCID